MPPNIPVKNPNRMVPMDVTVAEANLLLRLRGLKKCATPQVLIVMTDPLTVGVMGPVENLGGMGTIMPVFTSGS